MALEKRFFKGIWFYTRHVIIPAIFVFLVPIFGVVLALFPRKNGIAGSFDLSVVLGNQYSWKVITCLFLWAILSLKIPSKVFRGPTTAFGFTPLYSSNGFEYFCSTLAIFAFLNFISPSFAESIYEQLPQLLGTLNIIALIFCFYLWVQGRHQTNDPVLRNRLPFIFEFYRGMELHPRIFNMDVKQLINSRIGLMMWQLLTLTFLITSYHRYGFNSGIFVNVAVQFAYLTKFYWWETGYFTTMDVTIDRPGFYITWGHLNFVPSFYTFSTYYLVHYPSITSDAMNYSFLILGILSVYFNYAVDRQKELFIHTQGKCDIWGRKVKCIKGSYKSRKVRLLASGYWGIVRHANYDFELLLALFWNLPCSGLGIIPFMYNIYLIVLLIHRIYRDEEKCRSKYGPIWKQYINDVPYRLIPKIY